ncbi:MAG: diphthine--ammonia ligase [Chloroflexia bacterium]|nr:diphthine--ammonia ligase [Chloroflexia bacterium]
MKLFSSWSGGKDCMLALYRIQQTDEHKVVCLVNMCDADGKHSRSHGLRKDVVAAQAKALEIPIIQKQTDIKEYETNFKSVITDLKKQGIEGGVFGDIYLEAHRIWIEGVCREMDIEAVFPLWRDNTHKLLNEFINLGFKALTVSIHQSMLDKNWLGRDLDETFVNQITKLKNIDPCAENGEYHSFVYDGPNFKSSVGIVNGEVYEKNNHWFQEINLVK